MSKFIIPEPLMGATLPVGSDRYPYTVIAVSKKLITAEFKDGEKIKIPRSIIVIRDDVKKVDDEWYNYTVNYDSTPKRFIFNNRTKRYREETLNDQGQPSGRTSIKSLYLILGERSFYYDPHF